MKHSQQFHQSSVIGIHVCYIVVEVYKHFKGLFFSFYFFITDKSTVIRSLPLRHFCRINTLFFFNNVDFALEQAKKAQRGSGRVAVLFL